MIDILTLLLRYKKIIIAVAVISFLLSAAVSLLLPKRFVSSASIVPDFIERDLSGGGGFLSQFGDFGRLYSNIMRVNRNRVMEFIIRSREMASLMDEQLDLKEKYGVSHDREVREELGENTGVVVRDEGVILISVEDGSAEGAREMVEHYLKNLDSLMIDLEQESARYRIAFLEQERSLREQKISELDSSMASFMREHGIIEIEEQVRASYRMLTELSSRKQLLEMEKELLRMNMKAENPFLRRTERELEILDETIREILGGGKNETFALIPDMEDIPALAAEYFRLVSEKRVREFALGFVKMKLEQARLSSRKDVSVIRVIDSPYTPDRRVWPRRSRIVLISTIIGVVWCCIILVIYHRREELRGVIGLDSQGDGYRGGPDGVN
jgi:capsule polysaccharide export protein KpsE/RkpR